MTKGEVKIEAEKKLVELSYTGYVQMGKSGSCFIVFKDWKNEFKFPFEESEG